MSETTTDRVTLTANEHRIIASHFRYAASLMDTPSAKRRKSNWEQGFEEGFTGAREVLLDLASRHEKLAS